MTERVSVVGKRLAAAAWIGAALLGACHRGGEAPATPAVPAANRAAVKPEPSVDPAVAEANRSMAAGVPIGPAAGPIEVRFDLPAVPVPDETFAVEVAVIATIPAPALRVEITAGEGLAITDPEGPVTFEKIQAGSVTRVHVHATSAGAGTRLVQVLATLELPEGP